jgi:hypothetical protein
MYAQFQLALYGAADIGHSLQKKDDHPADVAKPGSNDQRFSGTGAADPNFTRYDQPGTNNGPGPGYNSSQQPYPHPDSHSKPSRLGGKVESAIGTVIGSDTLRAKGMEKEQYVCSVSSLGFPGLS